MDNPHFDAADVTFTPILGGRIEGVILYGPARSTRGRLLNLLRRLVRQDEQDEIIAYFEQPEGAVVGNGQTLVIRSRAKIT